MNFATRKAVNPAAQRRLDFIADRTKARALRTVFPDVELVQIDLMFLGYEPIPSPQAHSMYPAAQAFFRFPCPCVDCDGELDLSALIAKMAGAGRTKSDGHSAKGEKPCHGVHWRDSARSAPCRIEFRYRVRVKNTS